MVVGALLGIEPLTWRKSLGVCVAVGGVFAALATGLSANTMTVNPVAAGLLATQLVGEPITLNLVIGLVAVVAGIWLATTQARPS